MPIPKTADLSDQHHDHTTLQYVQPIFQHYGGRSQFHGRIRTVKCFEDNSQIRATLAEAGHAAVLVVDAGGSQRCAMLGDRLAQLALDNAWAGVIIYGMIRDRAVLDQLPLGVRALGCHPLKSQKDNHGKVDVVVRFADTQFVPGAYVYADEDGIIVSPQPLA